MKILFLGTSQQESSLIQVWLNQMFESHTECTTYHLPQTKTHRFAKLTSPGGPSLPILEGESLKNCVFFFSVRIIPAFFGGMGSSLLDGNFPMKFLLESW